MLVLTRDDEVKADHVDGVAGLVYCGSAVLLLLLLFLTIIIKKRQKTEPQWLLYIELEYLNRF
jgi:hypothetical protein